MCTYRMLMAGPLAEFGNRFSNLIAALRTKAQNVHRLPRPHFLHSLLSIQITLLAMLVLLYLFIFIININTWNFQT